MTKLNNLGNIEEARAQQRCTVDKYYSVEFCLKDLASIYQFKIWNTSNTGMCIIVREDSAVISNIHVGEVFEMKYYPKDLPGSAESLETEVRHITRDEEGKFRGHFMVGLSIIKNNTIWKTNSH